MNKFSRRDFIRSSSLGVAAFTAGLNSSHLLPGLPNPNDLTTLARDLSATWAKTLLQLQITDKTNPHYGTLIYPPENKIHGRMGDTFYPFLFFADQTKNTRYLDAAILLYQWMEKTVSQDDGSWLNEPVRNSWKGTTVFTSIALAEAIRYHGQLLDNTFRSNIEDRLRKSGNYIFNNFSPEYGNINYPIAGAYCLSLLGEILDIPKFRMKGKDLAHEMLHFLTPVDHFIHGEGTPYYTPSAKGCFSVDLGYNVEESLPSLILYSQLTNDQDVMEAALQSMQTHLEFMLPDGGWDNSWGTRNYKWTWWGSRTSDGCQPAYALAADKNPAFYNAALKNTQLLKDCTRNGILYGGPHYISHQIPASLHHTFCHLKALVTILDHGIPPAPSGTGNIRIPAEISYGTKFFQDIQTWLVSHNGFRATVTGYDRNYKDFKAGHASGGALSLLWHEKAGIILAASMNEYQLYESGNMQKDSDPTSIPLTLRIEFIKDGRTYSNINDFSATISEEKNEKGILIKTQSKLVDKDQLSPASGEIQCQIDYLFTKAGLEILFSHDNSDPAIAPHIVIPVISPSSEEISLGKNTLTLFRKQQKVVISADQPLQKLPTGKNNRVFNFVPGLEAIPLIIPTQQAKIRISCPGKN